MLAHWPPPRLVIVSSSPHTIANTLLVVVGIGRVVCLVLALHHHTNTKKNAEKHFVRRKKSLAGKICWEQKKKHFFSPSPALTVSLCSLSSGRRVVEALNSNDNVSSSCRAKRGVEASTLREEREERKKRKKSANNRGEQFNSYPI